MSTAEIASGRTIPRPSLQVFDDLLGERCLHGLRLIDGETVHVQLEVRVALLHSQSRRYDADRIDDGVVSNAGGGRLDEGCALRRRLRELECLRVLNREDKGWTARSTSRSGPSADLASGCFSSADAYAKRGTHLGLREQRARIGWGWE